MPAVHSANKPAETDRQATSSGVSRTIVNFCLDAVLLVVFLALTWVSFVLRFIFPPATRADGWTLGGYSYDDWSNFQFGILCTFMLGVLVHVMLHWTWICGVITSRLLRREGKVVRWEDGTRTLLGVGLLVVIVNVLGGLMMIAALMIRSPV